MRVVIAPDKFKGCLSAPQVAAAIAQGVRRANPAIGIEEIPMADGGEGTVDALVAATGGKILTRQVTGPLPDMKVQAAFGILGDGRTAVIEMAAASGLHLLRPEQYDPTKTTTYGTGELILAAFEAGATRIIVGIGGSATVDGGIGCAQACGIHFEIDRHVSAGPGDAPLTGGDLIYSPATPLNPKSPSLPGVEIVVASDVDNPLYGPSGAARVFGPQKGATPEQVEALDTALMEFSQRVNWGFDLWHKPGAGAAGGLGFGLMAFLGATVRSGFEVVAEAVELKRRLAGADLCITGEGRLDASSLHGKTAIGLARLCKSMNIPCVALVGAVGEGAEGAIAEGLTAYFSICDRPMELTEAMARAQELLETAAAKLPWVRRR